MKVREVANAIIVEPFHRSINKTYLPLNFDEILDLCCNLVRIEDEQLEFFHSSVKEFLQSEDLEASLSSYSIFGSESLAHQEIGQACLTYLTFSCFRIPALESSQFLSGDQTLHLSWEVYDATVVKGISTILNNRNSNQLDSEYPLLSYACLYWSDHLAWAGASTHLSNSLQKFMASTAMVTWIAVCSLFDSDQNTSPSPQLASLARVKGNLKRWCASGTSLCIKS